MTPAVRSPACVLAAAIALLLTAACQDGGDRQDQRPTPTPPVTTSPHPTTTPPPPPHTSTPPTPPATAPDNSAKAEAEIKKVWEEFFNPRTSVMDKAARVEDGELYELMVRGFAEDRHAGKLRVRVTAVEFASAADAEVTYTLLLDGQPLRPDGPGTSVLQDDTWKISLRTVCSLTRYGADVPQAAACTAPPTSAGPS